MNLKMACCFTGHRPNKLPWGYDENIEACVRLKNDLALWITKLIDFGINKFYTGMAMGADIWAAEIILDIKKQYPHKDIQLLATIPYQGQEEMWSYEWRKRYENILEKANERLVLFKQYATGCFYARNRYMVDNSSFVIAVFSGEEGGTKYTIDYAVKKGLRVKILDPRQYL